MRRIEITTKRLVDQGVAGGYHSVFKGRGMEFSEVRPYQPGDDVRSIDWNRTARMGIPYVKQFVEERDLTVLRYRDAFVTFGTMRYPNIKAESWKALLTKRRIEQLEELCGYAED